jgi:Cupin domain
LPGTPGKLSWNAFPPHVHGGRYRRPVLDPVISTETRELVIPHAHRDEDEFSFVFRGRIGGRVGDHDVVIEEGGFLFQPRGIVHALWNPTDLEAITLVLISPAAFEGFFEEIGGLQGGASPETVARSPLATD